MRGSTPRQVKNYQQESDSGKGDLDGTVGGQTYRRHQQRDTKYTASHIWGTGAGKRHCGCEDMSTKAREIWGSAAETLRHCRWENGRTRHTPEHGAAQGVARFPVQPATTCPTFYQSTACRDKKHPARGRSGAIGGSGVALTPQGTKGSFGPRCLLLLLPSPSFQSCTTPFTPGRLHTALCMWLGGARPAWRPQGLWSHCAQRHLCPPQYQ